MRMKPMGLSTADRIGAAKMSPASSATAARTVPALGVLGSESLVTVVALEVAMAAVSAARGAMVAALLLLSATCDARWSACSPTALKMKGAYAATSEQ